MKCEIIFERDPVTLKITDRVKLVKAPNGEKSKLFETIRNITKNAQPRSTSGITNRLSDIETVTDASLEKLYNNYVNLISRNESRADKAMSLDGFKGMVYQSNVFKYEDTYVFGKYDSTNNNFIISSYSSPSSKDYLAKALPEMVKNYNVISFSPEDIGSKYVRSGFTASVAGYDYNFKGEKMFKRAYFSNPEIPIKMFGKSADQLTADEVMSMDLRSTSKAIHSQIINEMMSPTKDFKLVESLLEGLNLSSSQVGWIIKKLRSDYAGPLSDESIKEITSLMKGSSQRIVDIYEKNLDLVNTPVVRGQLNTQLNKDLASFLSQFGVKINLTQMQDKLGIDAMGTADLLNKIIHVDPNNTEGLPRIAGEFIVYMMQHDPLMRDLMRDVSKLLPFKLKNDEAAVREYITDLIANELHNKSNTEVPKSLAFKIKKLLDVFFNMFKRSPTLETAHAKVNTNVGIIAQSILNRNVALIKTSSYKPGAFGAQTLKVDLNVAMESDLQSKGIILTLAKKGFMLTGSVTLAEQGSVFRPDENQMHDIDFVSPFTRSETIDKFLKLYPDSVMVREIIDKDSDDIVDTYLIPPDGHKIKNLRFTDPNRRKIEGYDIVNSSGKIVSSYLPETDSHTTDLGAKLIDFFTYETFERSAQDVTIESTGDVIPIASWKDTFVAKLKYARVKDMWDYNNFIPNENLISKEENNDIQALTDYYKIYTDDFKSWFGDWQTDPTNSSKVLDSNGEPLLVYHGAGNSDMFPVNQETGPSEGRTLNGAHFTDNPHAILNHNTSKVYPVFLNIRRPKLAKDKDSINNSDVNRSVHDGAIIKSDNDSNLMQDEYVAFESSQVKTIFNPTKFDKNENSDYVNPTENINTDEDVNTNTENDNSITPVDTYLKDNYFQDSPVQSHRVILTRIAEVNPKFAALANKLLNLQSDNIQVTLIDEDYVNTQAYTSTLDGDTETMASGIFNSGDNTIQLAQKQSHPEATMLHEIIHGYTARELNRNTEAAEEMTKIYEEALLYRESFDKDYPLTSVEEFIVAVYTNPEFIKTLQQIPSMTTNKSLWEDFTNFIKSMLKFNLTERTLYDDALYAANKVLESNSRHVENVNNSMDEDAQSTDAGTIYANVTNEVKVSNALVNATESVMKSLSKRLNVPLGKVYDDNKIIKVENAITEDSIVSFIRNIIGDPGFDETEILYQKGATSYKVLPKYIKNLGLSETDYFLARLIDGDTNLATGARMMKDGVKLSARDTIVEQVAQNYKELVDTIGTSSSVVGVVGQGYMDFAATVADNNGQFEDAARFRSATEADRIEYSNRLREGQLTDFKEWVDYLDNRPDYPIEFKYYVLSNIAKQNIISIDLEGKSVQVSKRTSTTVKSFQSLNAKALANVYDSPTTSSKFMIDYGLSLLSGQGAIPSSKQFKTTPEGIWYKFVQGDHGLLSGLAVDTPWCTSSSSVAADQLSKGDFFVFAPFNSTSHEKIAIKFVGDTIGEVRGTLPGQDMKGSSDPLVEEFVTQNFPNQKPALKKLEFLKLRAEIKRNPSLLDDKNVIKKYIALNFHNDSYSKELYPVEIKPQFEAALDRINSEFLEKVHSKFGSFEILDHEDGYSDEYLDKSTFGNISISFKLPSGEVISVSSNSNDVNPFRKGPRYYLNILNYEGPVKLGGILVEKPYSNEIESYDDILGNPNNKLEVNIQHYMQEFIPEKYTNQLGIDPDNLKYISFIVENGVVSNVSGDVDIINQIDPKHLNDFKLKNGYFNLSEINFDRVSFNLLLKILNKSKSFYSKIGISTLESEFDNLINLMPDDLTQIFQINDFTISNTSQDQLEKLRGRNLKFFYGEDSGVYSSEEGEPSIPLIENGTVAVGSSLYMEEAFAVTFKNWKPDTIPDRKEERDMFEFWNPVKKDSGDEQRNELYQKNNEIIRGVFAQIAKGKSVILLHKDADVTTPLHELTHLWETTLTDQEKSVILDWTGQTKWDRETSEAFAKGFERYVYQGVKTGNSKIDNMFSKFSKWFKDVIKNFNKYFTGSDLNQEVKNIYNNMLTEGDSLSEKFVPLQREYLENLYSYLNEGKSDMSSAQSGDTNIVDTPDFQNFNSQNPNTSLEENLAYYKQCKI